MPTDYQAIANDKDRHMRSAANGIRILSGLYADRTHFLYELLQNAEDALRRQPETWKGNRIVAFDLDATELRVRHSGVPFSSRDIESICTIGDSTKELTDIGHFGIGFKSVYAFTERPLIYSGEESFAIEQRINPVSAPMIAKGKDETIIRLPFSISDTGACEEISHGLLRLDARSLLFLREIESVMFTFEHGRSGKYIRSQKKLEPWIRQVSLCMSVDGDEPHEDSYLVFSEPISDDSARHVGYAEIAYQVQPCDSHPIGIINPLTNSNLYVFFPTAVETHLGFLIQGPYQTTPARDNIPDDNAWNLAIVLKTANLLLNSLVWLRDNQLLTTDVLECLPLDPIKFGPGTRFAALHESLKQSLMTQALLPRWRGGFVAGERALIARTEAIRASFSGKRLSSLYQLEDQRTWLNEEITRTRSTLFYFLTATLKIPVVTPESIVAKLDENYLKTQSSAQIRSLYEFLGTHSGQDIRQKLNTVPIVRLDSGKHVLSHTNGRPCAYLPANNRSGFPTVAAEVCSTSKSKAFLAGLGLTEPDPVDDVIENVLKRYRQREVRIGKRRYADDIDSIVSAFRADVSSTKSTRLIYELKRSYFVAAQNMGNAALEFCLPSEVHLSTERLRELFRGVPDIRVIDSSRSELTGEDVRDLLVACGVSRGLKAILLKALPGEEDRAAMRVKGGCADYSGMESVEDWRIVGLDQLMVIFEELSLEEVRHRSSLLWEALIELATRRPNVFTATYRWKYHTMREWTYEPAFISTLNNANWVISATGKLLRPSEIQFEEIDPPWTKHPVVLDRIRFQPEAVTRLADEAGIPLAVLMAFQRSGKSLEDILQFLDAKGDDRPELEGVESASSESGTDFQGRKQTAVGHKSGVSSADIGSEVGSGEDSFRSGSHRAAGSKENGTASTHRFGSYVSHGGRSRQMSDEDKQERSVTDIAGIDFVRRFEESQGRQVVVKEHSNPGYDIESSSPDHQLRYIEVKSCSGAWDSGGVGLSDTQFEANIDMQSDFWLYVVEHAGTDQATLYRIRDPAANATHFFFDEGWKVLAEPEPRSGDED